MSIMTCDRQALVVALTTVARVVEKRNTIPILANVIIEGDRRSVTIRGTDLDLECVVRLRSAKAEGKFAFTVSAHSLLDLARKAKGDTVVVDAPRDDGVTFRVGTLNLTLHTLPVADFPKFDPP